MGQKRPPVPAKNAKTFEELHKAAHSGRASVKNPVPGTY